MSALKLTEAQHDPPHAHHYDVHPRRADLLARTICGFATPKWADAYGVEHGATLTDSGRAALRGE